MPVRRVLRRIALPLGAGALVAAGLSGAGLSPADAAPARPAPAHLSPSSRACPPSAVALGYSDALDKLTYHGVELGGLSDLAYDRRSAAWVSSVDNHGSDPSRLWFFRDLAHPTVVRDPLVLKAPDGTPFTGLTADNEGLAVLPDGDYLVSSETEPSIRVFGRDGVQKSALPVPARFAVTGTAPGGQATSNATLEGLTISPSGRTVVAAMEGPLSGDTTASDTTAHRWLVYRSDGRGGYRLAEQVGYRTAPGNRIPEVAALSDDSVLVEEAAFSTVTGNSEQIYAVTGLEHAPDVSRVPDLALAPARDILSKTLVADLVRCPTLGAPAREAQANPLLDNYEGMAITANGPFGVVGVSLISDDNFSATQYTRVLNLALRLPARH